MFPLSHAFFALTRIAPLLLLLLCFYIPTNPMLGLLQVSLYAVHMFFLGELIDFQFKIFFQVNSSLDRFIYRLCTGYISQSTLVHLLQQILGVNGVFAPMYFTIFMAIIGILCIVVSWKKNLPFHYKHYHQPNSKNFFELRFLDSFEKTLLFLCIMFFCFSFPEIRYILPTTEQLWNYLDPYNNLGPIHTISLEIFYHNVLVSPKIFQSVILEHKYIVDYGLFLLINYSFFRYFFSRRCALLGVFALLTTWRLARIMALDFGVFIQSQFPLYWVWALIWSIKGKTYRSGLFVGLVAYWGLTLHFYYLFLIIPSLWYFYHLAQKELLDRTVWFNRQHFRYFILSFMCCSTLFLFNNTRPKQLIMDLVFGFNYMPLWKTLTHFYLDKAFFIITVFAIISFLPPLRRPIFYDKSLLILSSIILLIFIILASFTTKHSGLLMDPIIATTLTFLALIPLEWFFLVYSRTRSKRNAIYVIYILICLLDSHFEGRVKHMFSITKRNWKNTIRNH